MIASLIGASVGVPYLASQNNAGPATPGPVAVAPQHAGPPGIATTPVLGTQPLTAPPLASPTGATPGSNMPVSPAAGATMAVASAAGTPATAAPVPRLDGAQFTTVAQVLRFDVTKDWVYRNWSRKTTAPTDVGLESVRVPLVMGTQLTALVGSLTYNFNAGGQVEHISFRGRTGDATQLVHLLTRYYQFQPVSAPAGQQLLQVRDGDGVKSELRLQPEAIQRSGLPQQNIVVELELARPGSPRYLPPHGPALQIPQAEAPPPSAEQQRASAGVTDSVKSAARGYWDQVRYATPDERLPLHTKRWPQ